MARKRAVARAVPLEILAHGVYTGCIYGRGMKKTKTFKSGNSIAVRLPKALGIEAGVEMTVREERGRYIVEPVPTEPKKIDLTGIAGSMPWLKPLTPEERVMEPRELDWEGKLLKRG
jgi:antitoxin VapB